MKKNERRNARGGFTLIEILLVVVIIGILAAVAVPRFAGRIGQSKDSADAANRHAIELALDMYEVDHGQYPSSLQSLVSDSGDPNWHGPYLKKGVPKDPWGGDYSYSSSGNSYTLSATGGGSGGE